MAGCGCGCNSEEGSGPFSKGKELVEFVYNAHEGTVRDKPMARGPIEVVCQGCGSPFVMETYLAKCPECDGVHAVAPMNPVPENVQFAGKNFKLP
jgi:hypothetical protein